MRRLLLLGLATSTWQIVAIRGFIGLMAGSAAAATCSVPAAAAQKIEPLPEAMGMLYDTTVCIGCKSCVVACREAGAGRILVTGLAADARKLALARSFGADATIDAIRSSQAAGASAFLTKPVAAHSLLDALADAVEHLDA